ncbi:MAG: hypothetical protein FJW56_05445 [Actinobacteria bacterium]|nr:hypothetical protein [Actinomycetota bacterium]
MKTYALTLKLKSGLLTELQSDTIYGHFCWRLEEQLGEKKLTDFLSLYKNGNPIFLLSDGLLKVNDIIRFPRPFIFAKPEIKKDKYEKVLDFADRKAKKERNYLTIDEMNSFLSNGKVQIIDKIEISVTNKKNKKKSKILEESLRVSVQIDRRSFGSMQGRLFSYKTKYPAEDVVFVVLVKVIDEVKFNVDFKCEQILKDTFSIGYGKKKSSGYGHFEILSFEEFNQIQEPKESNAFIALGNYLPSINDKVVPIAYDINTKYGKLGEELSSSENPFKNPIVFLTAGSCFKTDMIKEFFGRVTGNGEISQANNFAVQFGIPFTLKFIYDNNTNNTTQRCTD